MPARAESCRLRVAGFSLVELLVALAVFAMAALALLNLAGQSVRSAAHAEQRTLAGIVADTLAAEAMLVDVQALMAPAEGQQAGADTAWHWRRQARAIDGQLLQVDIQVAADAGGQVLAEASLVRSLR
ncbi:MAG: type II secretion system minor pseudopilin GspI [Pseudoxanthomonas sp.]|nr:type II secretion system minor pseudopilin GspI [Pseudoxanthomonas sp.]MBP8740580.1 type II secretion system minor pseudopilin GspI [Pseudoxanthomonas sp.]MBP8803470.1 type II secretion system minor pseudopilin GspI [Pseudoxanthomonas sp.]MBP9535315.1 type II secretion system minor pseudopilin GspI [Pseudoxanthomonas sp.]MBP9645083.1 type II secretion system minor pseudopilin GspI [Pseudoxanthomonas sp.]